MKRRMRTPYDATQLTGADAEQRAIQLLCDQGLKLVSRNFRCKAGEIDIIMIDQGVLVFIEVRYRRSRQWGGAAASITHTKQQRIMRAAGVFLTMHRQFRAYRMRFDAVCFDPAGEQWIRQAFSG